jgi:NitT/TauT family transport system ATP-binding protein
MTDLEQSVRPSMVTAARHDGDATGKPTLGTSSSAAMPAAVTLDHVTFRYPDGLEAVRGVSLEIAKGASVGFIGPSGCGKSTLLSLIAGQKVPSEGTAAITSADPSRHPLAMVFQGDTLLPWLTVKKNVALYYRFNRGKRHGVDAQVAELIRMAGLEGFEDSYPYQLSGGMRRRVAFLTAAASRAETLLLDEPFSSLDEPTRVGIHQDVLRIVRALGTTVVLVTHDLAEALTLCDQVVVLSARPARVVAVRSVPFGEERDVLALRHTPEFLELYASLWDQLSEQIALSRTPPEPHADSPRESPPEVPLV